MRCVPPLAAMALMTLLPAARAGSASERLRDGLTFYAPFEEADQSAWLAGGEPAEQADGRGVTRVAGVCGRAIVPARGSNVTYATRGNLDGLEATLSMWIKPDAESLRKASGDGKAFWIQRFFTTSWSTQGRVYVNFTRGGPVAVNFYDWHPDRGGQSAGKPALDWDKLAGWHHIVCQWGNNRKRFYWDGELTQDIQSPTAWKLGTRMTLDASAGNTAFDELAAWNRMLSDEEVRTLYKLGRDGQHLLAGKAVRPKGQPPVTAPAGANVIRNGGFELGIGGWEMRYLPLSVGQMVCETGAFDGRRCLKVLPPPATGRNTDTQRVLQGPFWLNGGKSHTVGLSLRGAGKARVVLRLAEGKDKPLIDQRIDLATTWKRHELSVVTASEVPALHYLAIEFEGGEPCWIDGVMLHEGDRKPAPAGFEAALSTDKLGNIFHAGEALTAKVSVCPAGGKRPALTLAIEDFFDREISRQPVEMAVRPGELVATDVPLTIRHHGALRAVLRDGDAVLDEMSFTVLPFTTAQVDELSEHLGAEMDPQDWTCAVMRRLGLRWGFVLDTSQATLWKAIEPRPGEYQFPREADIDTYLKHGLRVLGWIDHAPKWAAATEAWKSAPKREHLNAFEAYVEKVVGHYKGKIHHWLVWDEMNVATGTRGGSTGLYLEMVKRAYRAAKKADPACHVLSPACSGSLPWARAIVDQGGLAYSDIFSIDLWSARYPVIAQLAELSRADGRQRAFWDHGTGGSSRTFYRYTVHEPPSATNHPTYHDGAVELAKHVIDRRAAGLEKLFFYHVWKSQVTPSHVSGAFFEHDGSMRPFAVAFAMMGQYLYQFKPVKPLELGGNLTGFLFQRDGETVAALYAERDGFLADERHQIRDTKAPARVRLDPREVIVRLDTTLQPGQFELLDVMLNPTDAGVVKDARMLSIWIGESPVFITARGMTPGQLEAALTPRSPQQVPPVPPPAE